MATEPKIRMTPQRKVILEQVRAAGRHATADEIFHLVRRRLPHISLGTVYRNLDVLNELGLVRKLGHAGAQRRYEGNMDPHYHTRCLSCDKVDDIPFVPLKGIREAENLVGNFDVRGYELEFLGLCGECRAGGYGPAPEPDPDIDNDDDSMEKD